MIARVLVPVAVLLALLGSARSVTSDDAPDAEARGRLLFEQSVEWIRMGGDGPGKIESFFCDLHDVQFELGDTHQEGFLRVWYQAPDKFREEWRQQRAIGPKTARTTKILSGDRMWIVQPDGKSRRLHGTADGAKAIAQMKRDRDRFADLARMLTLEALAGPGVTFEDLGLVWLDAALAKKTRWRLIDRTLEGAARMALYLKPGAKPDTVTHPGVVVVHGDPQAKRPRETFHFSRWKAGAAFRHPGRIEAFSDGKAGATSKRFLLAFPEAITINAGVEAAHFEPPSRKAAGTRR